MNSINVSSAWQALDWVVDVMDMEQHEMARHCFTLAKDVTELRGLHIEERAKVKELERLLTIEKVRAEQLQLSLDNLRSQVK